MQIDPQEPQQAPIALVTGGAIRVGAAVVRSLAEAGYRVWIHFNRSQLAAQELATSLGTAAVGIVGADISTKNARRGLMDRVLDPTGPAAGHLDLLVNSAASFENGPFLERSDEDLLRVLNLNLVAPLSLARGFAPMLASRGGSIINILDLAAGQPWRGYADHCIAKAGLAMATRALAGELAPDLRVNGIAPGTVLWPEEQRFTTTEARSRIVDGIPLGRIGEADDVARAVLYLASEPFITGHTIVIDGGRSIARGSTL